MTLLLKKYIVCFPSSGLADMLSVIERCLRYAITHNRLLIIDTSQAVCNAWFLDEFCHYFYIHHPNVFHGDGNARHTMLESLNDVPMFPFQVDLVSVGRLYYQLDLSMEYSEDVIFHSSGGCFSRYPHFILSHLHVTPLVLDVYRQRRGRLPEHYTSVHIRNTDKKSDVPAFLQAHEQVFKEQVVFLASDHYDTIQSIKQTYPRVYTFSNIPNNHGGNIHTEYRDSHPHDRRDKVLDGIVDLLLLASADHFLFPHEESGYTRIAKHLHENKPILDQLLTAQQN